MAILDYLALRRGDSIKHEKRVKIGVFANFGIWCKTLKLRTLVCGLFRESQFWRKNRPKKVFSQKHPF
jgi:hypothetical protein